MSNDEMPTASGGKKANIRSAGKYQEEQYNVNRDRGGMSANNIARCFFFFLYTNPWPKDKYKIFLHARYIL